MLDEEMRRPDLAWLRSRASLGGATAAVVLGHVVLQLIYVGSLWWLPSRCLLGRVKVVR